MLNNIPHEMRGFKQWLVWKYEESQNGKPTKVPYSAVTNGHASVVDRSTWATFDDACAALVRGYAGVGFVFSKDDPFSGIDLDVTENPQDLERQTKIFEAFDSYAELSPSGKGLHIIVKGKVPRGRRRSSVELYSAERFFTMTGNVFKAAPIAERQELLDILWREMGGPAAIYQYGYDKPQIEDDETILTRAMNAENSEKFSSLWTANWAAYYPSQSEADFALVDMIAFYTQNRDQIIRLFQRSGLANRKKAFRVDYLERMVNRSFDRQLPPIDTEGLKIAIDNMLSKMGAPAGINSTAGAVVGQTTVDSYEDKIAVNTSKILLPIPAVNPPIEYPEGFVGELAQFIFEASPRPVSDIALSGALALMSGICGRAYNVSGTGLNNYIMMIAPTGVGKEAVASGVHRLIAAVKPACPTIDEFVGPSEIASAPALIRWLVKAHSFVSIIGEVGLLLKQMSIPNAPAHTLQLKRVILDLYNKSGHSNVFSPIAYSDKDKNTAAIRAPSFSIFGESTPEKFYQALDESMVSDGLLTRFTIFEYIGNRPAKNDKHSMVQPSPEITQKLAELAAYCQATMAANQVLNVGVDADALKLFDEFDGFCDSNINSSSREVIRQLWNRAHLKSLKLAALVAIGISPYFPSINVKTAAWAIDIICRDSYRIIGKFERGEVGEASIDERNQHDELRKAIRFFMGLSDADANSYGYDGTLARDRVVPYSAIHKRLFKRAAFKHDRRGATMAIKNTITHFVESDYLREIPRAQAQQNYGTTSRCFAISRPDAFLDCE